MHDDIWFAYKSRTRTQQRLENNNFHSQLLMVWYALMGVCFSVITIKHAAVLSGDTDLISALFSVGLLAIAMVVANRDFRGRSIEMRRNSLDLQSLHGKATATRPLLAPQEVHDEYQRLLGAVENHAEIDDKYFRVFQSGLASRKPTIMEFLQVYAYLTVRTVVLSALYLAPLIAALYLTSAYLVLMKAFE